MPRQRVPRRRRRPPRKTSSGDCCSRSWHPLARRASTPNGRCARRCEDSRPTCARPSVGTRPGSKRAGTPSATRRAGVPSEASGGTEEASMGIEEERLAEFFDAYAAALRDFDAEATARLWGLPGMVVTDDFAGALESRADMAAGLSSSYPLYR